VAYASRLQSIADDLDAVGRPVDDQDLALQFVDGLGRRYKLQAEILKTAMPSFADATVRRSTPHTTPVRLAPPVGAAVDMEASSLWFQGSARIIGGRIPSPVLSTVAGKEASSSTTRAGAVVAPRATPRRALATTGGAAAATPRSSSPGWAILPSWVHPSLPLAPPGCLRTPPACLALGQARTPMHTPLCIRGTRR
jgi:hypothetical protein